VGAVAEATSELLKLINSWLNPSQQKAAADLYEGAQIDMEDFCFAVLRGDGARCNVLIAGLRVSAPLPRLTDGDFDKLRLCIPYLDGSTLADLYVRARQGSYAADLADLISSAGGSASTSTSSSGNKSVVSAAISSAETLASSIAANSGN
jgi:hypothetical protein